MIRTTDTGGVKMIYNGVPTNGQCNNTGAATIIGTSTFNPQYLSLTYVGYMYNPNALNTPISNMADTGSLFGSGIDYANGTYSLTNTSTTYDNYHHYTCNNTTGSCTTVRYYYYNSFYLELNSGYDITQKLKEILNCDNVNQTNSTIKTVIDNWYSDNLSSYTEKLEDTIFCNDRSISSLGGWNPNGGGKSEELQFKNSILNNDLSCQNITDQFSLTNNKAKLIYPIGLMSSPEMNILNNNNARKCGQYFWLGSPCSYKETTIKNNEISTSGTMESYSIGYSDGVRPAISLAPGTKYTTGDGSKDNPYIVN